jgi:hypothetical protein
MIDYCCRQGTWMRGEKSSILTLMKAATSLMNRTEKKESCIIAIHWMITTIDGLKLSIHVLFIFILYPYFSDNKFGPSQKLRNEVATLSQWFSDKGVGILNTKSPTICPFNFWPSQKSFDSYPPVSVIHENNPSSSNAHNKLESCPFATFQT